MMANTIPIQLDDIASQEKEKEACATTTRKKNKIKHSKKKIQYSSTEIFVMNLPKKMSELEIFAFFSQFGTVKAVRRGYKNKPFAFVTFEKRKDAKKMLFLSAGNLMCRKRQFYVERAKNSAPNIETDNEKSEPTEEPQKVLKQYFYQSTGESYWAYDPPTNAPFAPIPIYWKDTFWHTKRIERIRKLWNEIRGRIERTPATTPKHNLDDLEKIFQHSLCVTNSNCKVS